MAPRMRPPKDMREKLRLADAVLRGDRDAANKAIRELKAHEQFRRELLARNAAAQVTKR